MAILERSKRLKKELSLLDVYAISAGATLSSGFFLLPGLAAAQAGPAVILTYVIAAIPLLPGIMSKAELTTAMPRAGGVYYFIDRSLGPAFGTVGGLGTWLVLVLKIAFALIGMGAYLRLFWADVPMEAIAVLLAILFGVANMFGARKAGWLQVVMLVMMLICLLWFAVEGSGAINEVHFKGFFDAGPMALFSTAGMVCVSYIGLTKIGSVAEEVKDPEKTLPRAMFLALCTAIVVYVLGTMIMIGVLDPQELYLGATPDLTPVASTGRVLGGEWGLRIMAIAAVLAFFSVVNAGILSASRYPLAMARDHLMPAPLARLGRFGTPVTSIVVTVALIIVSVTVLDPLSIAKLAASFQLMLFAINCLAVIVMRESRIESYDPGYRSPFYPWTQIFGIIAPFALIAVMGWLPIAFTFGLVAIGLVWYLAYARRRVSRHGAIFHVFERLGRQRFDDLDRELRGIMKEKGLRAEDPFVQIVAEAAVIDADENDTFERVVHAASERLARRVPHKADAMAQRFLEGTRIGATPVSNGAALPHLRLPEVEFSTMVVVRSRTGVQIDSGDALGTSPMTSTSHALFFLISPESDPGQHLRLLAELASRIDQDDFLEEWNEASDEGRLKETLLRNERYLTLKIAKGTSTEPFIDRAIRELDLVDGCLVAVIRRARETIVPGGSTILQSGDRLTIIGSESAVRACKAQFAAPEASA